MTLDLICEYCNEEEASTFYDQAPICITCKKEAELSKSELSYAKKRNNEIEIWVKEQGEITLQDIMEKAYSEFVSFNDYGRVLHFYMKKIEK